MGRLDGKVAFITGAGSGIARATSLLFAQEGAKVVIAELDPDLGQAAETLVRNAGGDAIFIQTDVTKEDSVKNAIRETVERYGKLNILHNCAGGSIAEDTSVTDVDMSLVWDHTQSLDLLGTFLGCRHAIPEMIKAGGGAIINMSSVVALRGAFPVHVYTAAKGAVNALTKSLAGSYARNGIRANAICPGIILTERVRQRFGENLEQSSTVKQTQTVKIDWDQYPFATGQSEDIAKVALFLASDESRMLTGVIIPADGGLSAY